MGCTKESRVPRNGTRLSFVRPAAGPVARRSAAAKIRIYPDRRSRPDKKSDAAPDPPHSHPHTGTNPRHESGCSRVRARTARQIRRQTRTPGHRGIGAPGHRGTGTGTKKNGTNPFQGSSRSFVGPGPDGCYIMPPMPPAGIAGTAGCSDFFSASTHSVVRNIEAIDAAFSSATRDTFVGSMIPAASMSS